MFNNVFCFVLFCFFVLKKVKYSYLEGHPGICFTPIAFETSGVLGPLSLTFLKELGCKLSATTGDTRSYSYLLQRLSVAIKRGHAAPFSGYAKGPCSAFQWLCKGAMQRLSVAMQRGHAASIRGTLISSSDL